MKIYTKTGDDGTTGLFGGARIPKYADRIEAYGTIDELNAFIGQLADEVEDNDVVQLLRKIQNDCFDMGSVLATDPNSDFKLEGVNQEDIIALESAIDEMQEQLPPLKNFILPGGHRMVSYAHICRTVCRRAERRVVALAAQEEVEASIILYLNRLSDYFFVLSRHLGASNNIEEIKWVARK